MRTSPGFCVVGALCAFALALTACAGPPAADPDVAAVLSDGVERLAGHLDAADECRALAEVDALLDLTTASADQGLITPAVGAEVEGVVSEVAAGLTCVLAEDVDAPDALEVTESAEADTDPAESSTSGRSVDEAEDTVPAVGGDGRQGRGPEAGNRGKQKGREQPPGNSGNAQGRGKGNR